MLLRCQVGTAVVLARPDDLCRVFLTIVIIILVFDFLFVLIFPLLAQVCFFSVFLVGLADENDTGKY